MAHVIAEGNGSKKPRNNATEKKKKAKRAPEQNPDIVRVAGGSGPGLPTVTSEKMIYPYVPPPVISKTIQQIGPSAPQQAAFRKAVPAGVNSGNPALKAGRASAPMPQPGPAPNPPIPDSQVSKRVPSAREQALKDTYEAAEEKRVEANGELMKARAAYFFGVEKDGNGFYKAPLLESNDGMQGEVDWEANLLSSRQWGLQPEEMIDFVEDFTKLRFSPQENPTVREMQAEFDYWDELEKEIGTELTTLMREEEILAMEEEAIQDPEYEKRLMEGKEKVALEEDVLSIAPVLVKSILPNEVGWAMGEPMRDKRIALSVMTQEEKDMYSYYVAVDPMRAVYYLSQLTRILNERSNERMVSGAAAFADRAPVLATLGTFIDTPSAVARTAIDGVAETASSWISPYRQKADPYTPGQVRFNRIDAIDDVVMEKAGDNSLARGAIGAVQTLRDEAPGIILTAAGAPMAAAAYNGVRATAEGYRQSAKNGATAGEALLYGAGDGLVTGLLEYGPLDEAGKAFSGVGGSPASNIIRTAAKSASANYGQEAFRTGWGNLTLGEKSQMNREIAELVAQGYSQEEAYSLAESNHFGMNAIGDAVQGALINVGLATVGQGIAALKKTFPMPKNVDDLEWEYRLMEAGSISQPLEQSAVLYKVEPLKVQVANQIMEEGGVQVVLDGTLTADKTGVIDLDGTIRLNPKVGGPENLRDNVIQLLKEESPLVELDTEIDLAPELNTPLDNLEFEQYNGKEKVTYPLVNGPYIRNGKQYGRPGPSGKAKYIFETEVYKNQVSKDGILVDLNNDGIILDWKPGQPRQGVVDFGHKPGQEYWRIFERYKNGEISLEELIAHETDSNNFQIEDFRSNRSRKHEQK